MESKNFLFQVVLSDSKGNDLLVSSYFIEELDCDLLLDDLISSFANVEKFSCELNCVVPTIVFADDEYECKYLVKSPISDDLYLGIVKHNNCVIDGNI